MSRSPYASTWSRLIANTKPSSDTGQACWNWQGRKKCRYGYGRFNLYVPGLGKVVTLTVHLVTWIISEVAPASVDDLYLAYLELRGSGLQLDHGCVNTSCCSPDHLTIMTHGENQYLRDARRSLRFAEFAEQQRIAA